MTNQLVRSALLVVSCAMLLGITACGGGGKQSYDTPGDGDDSEAERQFLRVSLTNGRYVVSQGAPPGFAIGAMGENIECGFFEQKSFDEPALTVGLGSYYAGEFDIVPKDPVQPSDSDPVATVALVGLGDSNGESPAYPAISARLNSNRMSAKEAPRWRSPSTRRSPSPCWPPNSTASREAMTTPLAPVGARSPGKPSSAASAPTSRRAASTSLITTRRFGSGRRSS